MKTLLFALLLFFLFVPLQASQSKPGHTNDILEVKFNSDASKLLSYSAGDGWLILWEVKSGRILWRTKTEFIQKSDEYYTLTCFAFSLDQTLIASGSGNGTVQLWDAITGRLLWRKDAHTDSVTVVEFSSDGKTIASAASPEEGKNEIKLLRVEDGQLIKKLQGNPCTVIALRFAENSRFLRIGALDGFVSQWDLITGKQVALTSKPTCGSRRLYEWETSFTADLRYGVTRTGEKEITLKTTQTNNVEKKIEAEDSRVYTKLSADGQKLIVSGYGDFTFYNLVTGATQKIEEFSRTGSTIDLSHDGSLFAEGGSWGNAAIKITETSTGTYHFLDGQGQHVPPYQATDLEARLTREKEQRRALLKETQARRDKQAAIETGELVKRVYISFEHYGEMIHPGNLRIIESDAPNKSKVKKPAKDAIAVWLRLHNNSPLPIRVPTRSSYLPLNQKCFYKYANGKQLLGLCDNREISIWHGLEDYDGKTIPYGFDFGSSSILLPKTSVLFPVPLVLLKGEKAIHFNITFLKETAENKIENYGETRTLRFRQADLPATK